MQWLVLTLSLICAGMFYSAPAHATDLDPDEIRGKKSRTPISVLQNRFFLKKMRPEAGLAVGTFLNEAYTKTAVYGVRGGVFFNEWVGAEFQFMKTSVDDSDDRKALNTLKYRRIGEDTIVSPDPEVNPINQIIDLNAIYAPFYGKLNLLDQVIVYSDLYVTTGFAQVKTDQGDKTALGLGVGQRFYLFKALSLRVDFRDHIYKEKRAGKDSTKHALSIDFGASYFFM